MSHPIPPPPLDLPLRSSTDPSKHTHHQHHHIHRPHRSHHNHHRDKSVPQSAVVPSSSSNLFKDNSLGDLLSPITKVGSRFENHHSRGQSGGQNDLGGDGASAGRKGMQEEDAELVRRRENEREERERGLWREVERWREGRGEGDEYLQSTLTTLSTLSTSTTRRLDYTHYSLLSHLSSLCSTLSALAALSTSTSAHLNSFNSSTSDLARSMEAQIQQFEKSRFEEQKKRAQKLEMRVKGAGARMLMLEKRLKRVGEQVDGVEGAEREKGLRRRWRWKCVLGALGGLVGVVLLGMMVQNWPEDGGRRLENRTLAETVRWERTGGGLRELEGLNATVTSTTRVKSDDKTKETQLRAKDGWEPRFRMLEEL